MKSQRLTKAIACIVVLFAELVPWAAQATETTITTDGTVIHRKTVTRYQPIGIYIVIGLGVLIGGAIAYSGVRIIARAAELGSKQQSTDLAVDLSKKSVKITRLAQGGLVVLIGGGMVVYALYLLAT